MLLIYNNNNINIVDNHHAGPRLYIEYEVFEQVLSQKCCAIVNKQVDVWG